MVKLSDLLRLVGEARLWADAIGLLLLPPAIVLLVGLALRAAFRREPRSPRRLFIGVLLLLAAPLAAEDLGDRIKDRAARELEKRTAPGRAAPAAWCWSGGCDTGGAGSIVRRPSRLLPGRYWTLDLVMGRKTAGVGVLWELLPYPEDPELQADRVRVFVGPIAVTPWGEVDGLKLSLGLGGSVRIK